MEYAAPILDSYRKDNIQLLKAVQRRTARFVCNKYSRHERVTSMLQDLDWSLGRAESRLTLFHLIVHKEVDINEHEHIERNPRALRKGSSTRFRWPQTLKDCSRYKQGHSTFNFLIYKEVIHHYLSHGSNVYSCLLDASKAFDRVHYGTLFRLLLTKCVPMCFIRLVLDIYIRQKACALWNSVKSRYFTMANRV